jgi:hypothetical protein
MSDETAPWGYKEKDPIGQSIYDPHSEQDSRMLEHMKDILSGYLEVPVGEKLLFADILQSAVELMIYHKTMAEKLQTIIANVELTS